MDDTMLFMPPCCIANKLPKAAMVAPQRMLTFHTQGDVTMEKIYRAISQLMVGDHVLVLAMPAILPETAVFLQQCFERGWITHLILSSQKDYSNILGTHLWEWRDRILYTHNTNVRSVNSHMTFYNSKRAMVITGPMLDRPSNMLSTYSLMFYPNFAAWGKSSKDDWQNPLSNALLPDVLRMRKMVRADKLHKVTDETLLRFLELDFPPYPEPESRGNRADRYDFGN